MTDSETREARARRLGRKPASELRDPLTCATVGEWFADYHGYVPIQMAQGLSDHMRRGGSTFAEAYARLRDGGAIIELGSPDPPRGPARARHPSCHNPPR